MNMRGKKPYKPTKAMDLSTYGALYQIGAKQAAWPWAEAERPAGQARRAIDSKPIGIRAGRPRGRGKE